ncbi:hypothetical protein [Methylobacterium brachythecii]|uniref:Uncharacterized protein n=1 Tax=Methylobacterium brachythecii TaxID=1176177 RepID=A0A7W6AQS4_9HYPH|nr:hypothetical protein [Methylobacterium brachythecii]MBB3905535.1 hypothetical protein [Methylobacterium brachythecii]GLS46262.1 hypothetical protein GCM10007884_42540 [Methylobacterium brachythecii]
MAQATKRAACAIPGREKAQERQLPGPSDFSTPTSGHSAAAFYQQAANVNRDGYGRDGSRLIRNPGHLKQCITKLHDLHWLRRERGTSSAADEAGLYFATGVLEGKIAAADLKFIRDLTNWAERNYRRLDPLTRAELDIDLQRYGGDIETTQRWLGEAVALLDEERDRLEFWLALPVDLSAEEFAAKLKAKDAERQRNNSKTPRDQCPERGRPAGMPKATFYDGLKRQRKRMAAKIGPTQLSRKIPPKGGDKKAAKRRKIPPNVSVAPTPATVLTNST